MLNLSLMIGPLHCGECRDLILKVLPYMESLDQSLWVELRQAIDQTHVGSGLSWEICVQSTQHHRGQFLLELLCALCSSWFRIQWLGEIFIDRRSLVLLLLGKGFFDACHEHLPARGAVEHGVLGRRGRKDGTIGNEFLDVECIQNLNPFLPACSWGAVERRISSIVCDEEKVRIFVEKKAEKVHIGARRTEGQVPRRDSLFVFHPGAHSSIFDQEFHNVEMTSTAGSVEKGLSKVVARVERPASFLFSSLVKEHERENVFVQDKVYDFTVVVLSLFVRYVYKVILHLGSREGSWNALLGHHFSQFCQQERHWRLRAVSSRKF
mmetsp:Transcript_22348/g.51536  ORF Transcript_22348/g.51536 Transcript_22348/m.51536 type:complete len:323 (+) Transcript_22348:495-1463(+)